MDSRARRENWQAVRPGASLGLHRADCAVAARRVSSNLLIFRRVKVRMNSLADESIEAKTVEMEPLYHRVYSPWLAQLGENSSSVRPAQR